VHAVIEFSWEVSARASVSTAMAPSLKVIKGELKVAVMKREVTPPSRKVIKGESKAAVMKTEVEIPENSGQAI